MLARLPALPPSPPILAAASGAPPSRARNCSSNCMGMSPPGTCSTASS
jgi:hypothetical protein